MFPMLAGELFNHWNTKEVLGSVFKEPSLEFKGGCIKRSNNWV